MSSMERLPLGTSSEQAVVADRDRAWVSMSGGEMCLLLSKEAHFCVFSLCATTSLHNSWVLYGKGKLWLADAQLEVVEP